MGTADQQPLISVIVPVYKVEAYLQDCIESILHQTYKNLEIILVDDGSPDACPEICDAYAKQDSRIKVIHKINGGLSDARNAGLDICSGDYITFVDSDDLLTKQALEIMLTIAVKQNADLVIGNHQRFESIIPYNSTDQSDFQLHSPTEAMKDVFLNGCASWGRLYRKTIHDNIRFPIGEINEDEAIVMQILEHCHTIAQTRTIVYYYRCRSESITTSSFSLKKLAWYRHCKANYEWIMLNHPELKTIAAKRYFNSILYSLLELSTSDIEYPQETLSILEDLHCHFSMFKKINNIPENQKIHLFLLHYFPYPFYRWIIQKHNKMRTL